MKGECLRYRFNQQWRDLAVCAERLNVIDPALAREFKDRATLEIKAVPKIEAFTAAIRNKNLGQAKAELDGLVTITSYPKLKSLYEQAERAAILELGARLAQAKADDCKEYHQILLQEQASQPARVVEEASREVTCTPVRATTSSLSPCDSKGLADEGRNQYALGQLTAAIRSYEAAWSCNPAPEYAERGFEIACKIPSVRNAKLFWKRISTEMKQLLVALCVRNGITEEMLDAP